ncbi:MAG TPA: NADH:flavin oxidoreductase/NADH oxidase [Rhodospirillales bacterium]|nr:NADH:flavin oxidoreductase/NADH oxidase [Rhodospirillales bacterium]
MSRLFSPLRLRALELANRIVVSPMCQFRAREGRAGPWHLVHYGSLAMGGAGLVMVEATAAVPEGRITSHCLGLYDDACAEALRPVLEFCRADGTARLGLQLGHSGRKGSARPPQEGGIPLTAAEGAWPVLGPSPVPYDEGWPVPRAMAEADMERLTEAFVAATRRAAALGFDLLELHMAHGYLLHQFLSPLSNRRTDAYGGSLENRMRFPRALFRAMRAAWPEDRPLGVRISATDWVEGGWDLPQSIRFVRALLEEGCDFVDVSSGGLHPAQAMPLRPGYQVPFAEAIRRETGAVTWAVGLITGPRQAEAILAEGRADMVALARGFMDDPHWGWHAALALGEEIPYPFMYVRAHPSRWPGAREMRAD